MKSSNKPSSRPSLNVLLFQPAKTERWGRNMKKPCQKNGLVSAKGYGGLGGLLFAFRFQLCQTMMRCRSYIFPIPIISYSYSTYIILCYFPIFPSNCHSIKSGLMTSPVTTRVWTSGQNRDMSVEQALNMLVQKKVTTSEVSHLSSQDFQSKLSKCYQHVAERWISEPCSGLRSPRNLSGRAAWLASSTLQARWDMVLLLRCHPPLEQVKCRLHTVGSTRETENFWPVETG